MNSRRMTTSSEDQNQNDEYGSELLERIRSIRPKMKLRIMKKFWEIFEKYFEIFWKRMMLALVLGFRLCLLDTLRWWQEPQNIFACLIDETQFLRNFRPAISIWKLKFRLATQRRMRHQLAHFRPKSPWSKIRRYWDSKIMIFVLRKFSEKSLRSFHKVIVWNRPNGPVCLYGTGLDWTGFSWAEFIYQM